MLCLTLFLQPKSRTQRLSATKRKVNISARRSEHAVQHVPTQAWDVCSFWKKNDMNLDGNLYHGGTPSASPWPRMGSVSVLDMFSSSEVNREQLDCPGHLHSHFSDAKPLLWWHGFRGDLTSPRSVRSPWADGQACHLCHTCMPSLELK